MMRLNATVRYSSKNYLNIKGPHWINLKLHMERALLAAVAKPSKLKFNFNYSFCSCVYKEHMTRKLSLSYLKEVLK